MGSWFSLRTINSNNSNFLPLFYVGLFLLVGIFIFPMKTDALVIVSDDIAGNEIWIEANSPYVINNSITVVSGGTLTLEPGVIVKFNEGSYLNIDGKLLMEGTEILPIRLTSIFDDSIGGDTNGDGGASTPSELDEWGINFNPDSGPNTLHFTKFTYSYYPLSLYKTSLNADNLEIFYVDDAISFDESVLNFNNVFIHDVWGDGIFGYNGVFNSNGLKIENVLNGDAIGFYGGAEVSLNNLSVKNIGDGSALGIYGSNATVTDSVFSGGTDSGIELYQSWSTGPSSFHLKNSLVENYLTDGISVYSSRADILKTAIRNNGYGIETYDSGDEALADVKISGSVISGSIEYGVYSYSINPIMARGNYWGDPSGPYEDILNPDGLGDAIYGSVDFSGWLADDPTIEKKIDPVIIIPGILGSAEKNGVWVIDPIMHVYDDLIETLKANGYEEGKTLFTMPYDWHNSNVVTEVKLREKIAEVEGICSCNKVDIVAHSMGGLVARAYIQSPLYGNDVDQLIFLGTPHLGAPKAYLTWEGGESAPDFTDQILKFMLSKESRKDGFSSVFDYVRDLVPSIGELLPTYDYLKVKNSGELINYSENYPKNEFLENLNDNISNLLNSGAKIANIIGSISTSTINVIRIASSTNPVLWEHGIPDGFYSKFSLDKGLENGLGDGTVPTESTSFIDLNLTETSYEHLKLPSNAEGIVYKILTGKDASVLVDKWRIPNLKILIIKMLSPADIQVVAPNGSIVGKDFTTGQEINEIDGAFYSGFETDDEYITIPNPQDGEYKVVTQGTGNGGGYTVATALISDDALADKDFSATTLPGMITLVDISVDSNHPENITVVPEDQIPPIIVINSPRSKDYVRGDIINIDATTTDSSSGVLSFETTWDHVAILASTTVDSFYQKLGTHNFFATSTDYVGNTATSTVDFRIIATIQSLVDDIYRSYRLGWINKKGVKNRLLERIEKFIDDKKEKDDDHDRKDKDKNDDKDKGLNQALKALRKELSAERGKHINEQVYQLLVEDIKWLLDNN